MSGNNIKVVCRFRPMNRMEVEARSERCVDVTEDHLTVALRNANSLAGPEKDGFTFDRVFDTDSRQQEIFDWGVKGIVDDVMTGFNGTLFCYGQTGSGKTYTMMGADIDDPASKGIIPRIVEQIFASIMSADSSIEYTVKVSYMEIYMERIKDLLAPQNDNLSIHEDKTRGVYVKGLSDVYVGSGEEVYEVLKAGGASRAVSSTKLNWSDMNAESSRSHSIVVIGIHQRNVESGSQKSGNLYLVDLAGSEKVGKTGATGQTLEEAKKINKSLSALGMVINSLTDGKSTHVPYRDSKLTRILQESLGGNSRTTLIINCSPASYNEAETLSTLRFGMRAKSIKNKARVNVEMSPAELKAMLKKTVAELASLREHNARLENDCERWRNGAKVDKADWTPSLAASSSRAGVDAALGRDVKSPIAPATPTPGSISRMGTTGGLFAGHSAESSSSRPDTPTAYSLPLDEREEFLRRENELSDQLAERESALAAQEKLVAALREEIAYLKEQEATMLKDNKSMSGELSELRITAARMESDAKDVTISLESYKDRVAELQRDMTEQKAMMDELKKNQSKEKEEEKEKRKQEMLADMLSKIDIGGAAVNEKLHQVLSHLEQSGDGVPAQTRDLIRSHLAENQDLVRDLQDRLRGAQEEAEMQLKRRAEVEKMLSRRDAAYEELLDKTASSQSVVMADIREQYEARYKSQEEMLKGEIADVKEQAESRAAEIRRLQATVETYKLSNEELNRALTTATSGSQDAESFANSAREAERLRKQMDLHLAEFEISRKSLVKDLQNRCEKVVELEMQLDEVREQYRTIARSANSRTQQRKLEFLEYNLDALNAVQKQLVEQNSALKKEAARNESRLLARAERIQNLEAAMANAEAKSAIKEQKFQRELQMIRDKLQEAQDARMQANGYNHGRIAKPLRGGGGSGGGIAQGRENVVPSGHQSQQHFGQAAAYGGHSANALGRLREEEVHTTPKRQSWFFNSPR